ncbi:MAG TPA: flagellar basal-body MS-ring/collar protein FliF [Acidimicrobiales bacterium]|nr:flagellar basal-body MS-ring/collar protein FliF [Acidimicrobiales bacterium]
MAIVPASNFDQMRDSARRFASGFTRGQKAVTLGALAVVGLIGIVFMSLSGKPTYSILFTNLQASDAGAITQQLSADHVPYQLQSGGSTILVPQNAVDQERLAAAQAGLPAQSTVGLSLLDKEGLTTSELTQQADYLRALQGELEQTINSIQGVQGSQVSIAMAANQTFVLGNTNPTGASVLIDLSPNHALTYNQVQAITSLVASAVPGLTAGNVTVADSSGNLLAGPGVSDNGGQQTNAEAAYDDATAAKVEAYLTGVVGSGNADVQVNAQLDFDQVQTSTQSLVAGANGKPLTSCSSTQSTTTKYTGSGTPPGSSLSTSTSGSGNYTQTQKQQTCETGSQTSTVTQAPGTVKQQAVAVLVNSHALPHGLSLATLRQGVAAASGITTSRGDVLSFSSAPFAIAPAAKAVKASPLATFAKPGAAFLLLVIALFLLLRASKRARRNAANADPMVDASAFEQYYALPQELPTGELPSVRTAGLPARSMTSLQEIVDNQPEEVARVLTGWLGQRNR